MVPLTQLLPLNPLRKPQPLQGWVALFPLGGEGEPSCASLKFCEAVAGAPGCAMRAPPQGFGAVLIKVELHMHRSLCAAGDDLEPRARADPEAGAAAHAWHVVTPALPRMGAHLMCPPFDAAAVATSDAHTGGDALPPEALHLARARVARACREHAFELVVCAAPDAHFQQLAAHAIPAPGGGRATRTRATTHVTRR